MFIFHKNIPHRKTMGEKSVQNYYNFLNYKSILQKNFTFLYFFCNFAPKFT